MWDWVLSHQELVFARTSPEQKLRIVKEFQRRGEIVAVTGDRTNDIPALKCANLGIDIQSSTETSKESSDVILLDNNFAWIVQAIETGRLLGDNLKKVAIYLLPGGKWSVTVYLLRSYLSTSKVLGHKSGPCFLICGLVCLWLFLPSGVQFSVCLTVC
jgi:P-type E1-E2 ATPase